MFSFEPRCQGLWGSQKTEPKRRDRQECAEGQHERRFNVANGWLALFNNISEPS